MPIQEYKYILSLNSRARDRISSADLEMQAANLKNQK